MDQGRRSNAVIANDNSKVYMDLKSIITPTLFFLPNPFSGSRGFADIGRSSRSQLPSLPTINQIVSTMCQASFVSLVQTHLHLSPLTQFHAVFQTHLCSFCLNQLTSGVIPMACCVAKVGLATMPITSAILPPSSGRNSLNPMLIMGLTLPLFSYSNHLYSTLLQSTSSFVRFHLRILTMHWNLRFIPPLKIVGEFLVRYTSVLQRSSPTLASM